MLFTQGGTNNFIQSRWDEHLFNKGGQLFFYDDDIDMSEARKPPTGARISGP